MASISNLSSNYLQSLLGSLQNSGAVSNQPARGAGGTTAAEPTSDSGQLSPLAQMMSELQQLQQSNPSEYQQVTQQIATNLQSAAQTAQSSGNSALAGTLNQLATDFTNASKSGQLPNIQDLTQAMKGGGHHHHGHHSAGASDSDASSTSSTASQLESGSQSDSSNPMAIIMNTLASAEVTSSAS